MRTFVLLMVMLACIGREAGAVPVTHFTDFIPDATRTGFAGFETAPNTSDLAQPWVEGGLNVDVLGPGGGQDIWTTCTGFGPPTCQAHEGSRSWYHNGGDNGYTQLTRSGGADFANVGFLMGSGFFATGSFGNYATLLNGVIQSIGSFALGATGLSYLGFSGGGFDEVWLSVTNGSPSAPNSGAYQALQIDSIEISGGRQVPEPASLFLVAAGLIGAGVRRYRLSRP